MVNKKKIKKIGSGFGSIWKYVVLVAFILLLAYLFYGLTGRVVDEGSLVDITRAPLDENETTNITLVKLSIVSDENTIMIRENLTSDEPGKDCFVLDSWTDEDLTYFIKDENFEPIWILGNRSDNLVVELTYVIPYGCVVDVDGSNAVLPDSSGEDTQTTTTEGETSTNTGGGGPSGGGGSVDGLTSGSEEVREVEIKQSDSEEEYQTLKDTARKLAGLKEGEEIERFPFALIVVLVFGVLAIVGFIVYSFVRKPKQNFSVPMNGVLR